MKVYITIEGNNRLKRSFLNLKVFSIINISDILLEHGYKDNNIDDYSSFIVNKKIESLFKTYAKSKRTRGIIYSNPYLTEKSIISLFEFFNDVEEINEVILLDDYNVPKLKIYYHLFDEIIFFPSIKKIRLITCTNIPIER
jgi:hypothetical protein